MKEKNRFSQLMERLMLMSNLKNYTLANELKYDVSYISKWVSGRMIPSEKNIDRVLHGISHCVVESLDEDNRNTLYAEYRVDDENDLERAIFDNLAAEYNYVKNVKKDIGSGIGTKTSYYAELPLSQFGKKMMHPILRRVTYLDIFAAMDLFSMEHKCRMRMAGIGNENMVYRRDYPDVHYSLVVNLEIGDKDCVYDSIFFLNLLTGLTHMDFQLYGAIQVYGKIIFSIKDVYSAVGMLVDSNQCISVTLSEEESICNALYDRVKSLCSRETLLVRKVTMNEMLDNYDYIQSMISKELCWIIGHMTEQFVPDDLFEKILQEIYDAGELKTDAEEVRKAHNLTKNILSQSPIKIMIYNSALSEFVVSGELDFFNHKVYLSTEQRQKCIQYILELLKQNSRMDIKLIQGEFVTDFQYTQKQCVFLSDAICYIRLGNESYRNNIVILNGKSVKDMFQHFFQEVWVNRKDVVLEGKDAVISDIKHMMQSIQYLAKIE